MTPARRLATEVKARAKLPGARFDDLVPLCDLVLRKRGSAAAPFKGETRKQAKAKRRGEERVANLNIWWDCLNRAQAAGTSIMEQCELCGKATWLEPHHLESGSGRRRQQESVENMMAVCWSCHEDFHRNPRDFVRAVHDWCAKHGYPLPRRKEYR